MIIYIGLAFKPITICKAYQVTFGERGGNGIMHFRRHPLSLMSLDVDELVKIINKTCSHDQHYVHVI